MGVRRFVFKLLFVLGSGLLQTAEARDALPIPNEMAFKGWAKNTNYQSRDFDPAALTSEEISCADKKLYPTHPQMSLKEYYVGKSGAYDHFKLEGADEACLMAGKYKNGKGKFPCLNPHILVYVVVSDTYTDSCGNLYRGFVERQFFRRNEKMSTLFSLGRSASPKKNSEFPGDYETDGTTAVSADEFMLVAPLFSGDEEKIFVLQKQAAANGFVLDDKSLVFRRSVKP